MTKYPAKYRYIMMYRVDGPYEWAAHTVFKSFKTATRAVEKNKATFAGNFQYKIQKVEYIK